LDTLGVILFEEILGTVGLRLHPLLKLPVRGICRRSLIFRIHDLVLPLRWLVSFLGRCISIIVLIFGFCSLLAFAVLEEIIDALFYAKFKGLFLGATLQAQTLRPS
jgi:hypothetical protein